MMELKDQVVFISGSSRGLGARMAVRFAAEGCKIILNGRKGIPDELIDQINEYGVQYATVLGDISKAEDVKRMTKEAFDAFGRIDILVNNAGITKDTLLVGMKEADFEQVINVNLKGTFLMTKLFMKRMNKQRSGCIINMASVVGLHGNVGQASYAASKAGVIGLMKTTAREGALRGIRCNCIAPGMIKSDMTDALSDKVKKQIMEQIPLKRFGTPDDVADVALFLAKSDYVTGQVISVDGGMTI